MSKKYIYEQARSFGETIFDSCDDSCSVHIYIVNYKGDVISSGYLTNNYISSKEEWDYFFDNKTISKDSRTYAPQIDVTLAAFIYRNKLRADSEKYYVAVKSEEVEHNKLNTAKNILMREELCTLIGANQGMVDTHRSLAEATGGECFNDLSKYGVPMAVYIAQTCCTVQHNSSPAPACKNGYLSSPP